MLPASTDGAPFPPLQEKMAVTIGVQAVEEPDQTKRDSNPSNSGASLANDAWGPMHMPLELGTVDIHVANHDEGMEAAAQVSMVSTATCFDDLAAAVIAPSLGTSPDLGGEKIRFSGMVGLLQDCLAAGPIPIGLLPTLEKQAHSVLDKESASPSMASPTLESFLNMGTALLQEPLPPTMICSESFLRQDWKTDSESVQCQEIAGALRLELELQQLQKDIPSLPMAEHQMHIPQQSLPSSLMQEFLNLTSLECASGPRLLVYSW
jgi:hypothetical protein